MGENSKIEWTDHTFNPWIGCTKVAEGCKHCYAEALARRTGSAQWGPEGTRVITTDANWKKPLKWDREAKAAGVRAKVFCASLADVFENWNGRIVSNRGNPLWICEGMADWQEQCLGPKSDHIMRDGCRKVRMSDVRQRLFALIDKTPNLDWLLLTKRPENIQRMWGFLDGGTTGRIREFMDERESQDVRPYWRRNVWLGTSVACQADAIQNVPELLKCRPLSPVLFLSMEPLVETVDLMTVETERCSVNALSGEGLTFMSDGSAGAWIGAKIDWVIVGGESGPYARPMPVEAVRNLQEACAVYRVPFFFKQWGGKDKKAAGRELDGKTYSEFPTVKREVVS